MPDYTDRLKLQPGLRIIFPIKDGLDTRWKKVGDYNFIADVEPRSSDCAYSYKWQMTEPAEAAGVRAVTPEDVHGSHQVSIFYPKSQTCMLVGYTNALRISDSLFHALKRGQPTTFELDGPETLMVLHREQIPLPHRIRPIGPDTVTVYLDGNPVSVRTIQTVTDNGWHYWIMDNPAFPLMVKADGPFKWEGLQLDDSNCAKDEGKRIIDQLEKTGEATTQLILFDFDKDTLKPQSKVILNELSVWLKKHPSINLLIEGHCDSVGGYQYNIGLSQRRAKSVRMYLTNDCSLKAGRFTSKGYGYTKPIATNKTAEGRALNRRVVFKRFN